VGTRDRLKAAALARGESVQHLVGGLVDRFLAGPGQSGPSLSAIVTKLRAHEQGLRAEGIAGLSVFGSVARGDAALCSDIDLLAEFAPGANLSLVRLASLRAELSDLRGAPADLVERVALHVPVREAAARESIRIW
jgi:hypothetical protein